MLQLVAINILTLFTIPCNIEKIASEENPPNKANVILFISIFSVRADDVVNENSSAMMKPEINPIIIVEFNSKESVGSKV